MASSVRTAAMRCLSMCSCGRVGGHGVAGVEIGGEDFNSFGSTAAEIFRSDAVLNQVQ